MTATKIVEVGTYRIANTYDFAPDQDFWGPGDWADPALFEHIEVTGGMDPGVVVAQDNGGGGIELVEDATLITARQLGKWTQIKADRLLYLQLCDHTKLSDAPVGWPDWTPYRILLRNIPATLSFKTFPLDSTVAQDDIKVACLGNSDCDVTLEVVDPLDTDQLLTTIVVGNAISVSLATDSSGLITTTAQEFIDEVNTYVDSSGLVLVSLETGSSGGNVIDTLLVQSNLVLEADLDALVWPTAPTDPYIEGVN